VRHSSKPVVVARKVLTNSNLFLNFAQKLKKTIDNFREKITSTYQFTFPYSRDQNEKRQQIWTNLQKGILLEDTQTLIPWSTPFFNLHRYAEKWHKSGDRTNWYLGKHDILDGYNCKIEVMKWFIVPSWKRFSEIKVWLGHDIEGNNTFNFLKEKFTDLLGTPAEIKLEKFGELDLGVIKWTNKKIKITLVGIEQFACKYWLHIGLTSRKLY
jgi:hypothetical protein